MSLFSFSYIAWRSCLISLKKMYYFWGTAGYQRTSDRTIWHCSKWRFFNVSLYHLDLKKNIKNHFWSKWVWPGFQVNEESYTGVVLYTIVFVWGFKFFKRLSFIYFFITCSLCICLVEVKPIMSNQLCDCRSEDCRTDSFHESRTLKYNK